MLEALGITNFGKGAYIAVGLFILQFVYYQFQALMDPYIFSLLPPVLVDLTRVNDPLKLASLFHILVHAGFSIIIVHFLYQNAGRTRFVILMSIALIGLFGLLYILRIFLHSDFIKIAASNLLLFLATPFKTIFSIPALQLHNKNTSN